MSSAIDLKIDDFDPEEITTIDEYGICMQNRELSWLKFNERVLEESTYAPNPLLERLKFVAIFCSNMDEFFMVRVGSLTDYVLYAPDYYDNKTWMTAQEQLDAIYQQTSSLNQIKDKYFTSLVEQLREKGVYHLKMDELDFSELKSLEKYFTRNILPLLSPQIIDNRDPFPHIDNKRLHIAVSIEHKSKPTFGLIPMPTALDRIYFMDDNYRRFVLLEDIICHFSHLVFKPYVVVEKTIMAVTRNADTSIEEINAMDEDIEYSQLMQKLLKKRLRLAPVRLEFQYEVRDAFKEFFLGKLKLDNRHLFMSTAPLDLSYCYVLEDEARSIGDTHLVKQSHVPLDITPLSQRNQLMRMISRKDLLLSYPYEGISTFFELIRQAAEDPSVMSIKITLYRIDMQSKLAETLIRAAENGKEVIAAVELRARFDEENNITWGKRLYEAGCRVIYGPAEYKMHSKICLITRNDHGRINYITQIGTGNYNEKTAKLYTDLSFITANQQIGEDSAKFFNNLLLNNMDNDYSHLWVAPNHFKDEIMECIEVEKRKAQRGAAGNIFIKCNSLTDREIIVKLIEASQSGVKITMIVRGICCLIPQISGYTDNISVISIVGTFLEHSRIFAFGEGVDRKLYISSADLMTRNTERRVEVACPILDPDIKERIFGLIELMLSDNVKAWDQQSDGRYVLRTSDSDLAVDSQQMQVEQIRDYTENITEGERVIAPLSVLQKLKSWAGNFMS
ncbi:MAG: polyphosphate kinase 1 [Oscillospiraceae bacterium]|nr:polyphosphate kinase 1 [Oscillospiraceae bacterium]